VELLSDWREERTNTLAGGWSTDSFFERISVRAEIAMHVEVGFVDWTRRVSSISSERSGGS
jgi:hypothetical protein